MEVIHPADDARSRPVLVIHSWWGLTRSFRDFGARLAENGMIVGLADLFGGEIAESPADANRLRRAPRREPMYRNLMRAIGDLREIAGTGSTIGVVGFSMGGHWAVWLSQQRELPIGSTVLYYSARAGSFQFSRASFLAHFAEHDDYVSAAAKRRMAAQIAKAGRPLAAHDYPGTRHWFAETDRGEYHRDAAATALERTIGHLAGTGR